MPDDLLLQVENGQGGVHIDYGYAFDIYTEDLSIKDGVNTIIEAIKRGADYKIYGKTVEVELIGPGGEIVNVGINVECGYIFASMFTKDGEIAE